MSRVDSLEDGVGSASVGTVQTDTGFPHVAAFWITSYGVIGFRRHVCLAIVGAPHHDGRAAVHQAQCLDAHL